MKDVETAVATTARSIRKEGEGLRASLNKRNVTGAMMSGYAIVAERERERGGRERDGERKKEREREKEK